MRINWKNRIFWTALISAGLCFMVIRLAQLSPAALLRLVALLVFGLGLQGVVTGRFVLGKGRVLPRMVLRREENPLFFWMIAACLLVSSPAIFYATMFLGR